MLEPETLPLGEHLCPRGILCQYLLNMYSCSLVRLHSLLTHVLVFISFFLQRRIHFSYFFSPFRRRDTRRMRWTTQALESFYAIID